MRSLWRFFASQGLAYWAMCAYLFVEYVRPQQIFSAINGLPLGQVALGTAVFAHLASGSGFKTKGLGTWLLLLFTAILIASSFAAYNPSTSFGALRVWISWVVIYLLIINVANTEARFAFFVLVWLVCHSYMAQGGTRQFAGRGFRFADYGIIGAPGWFENSGEFGIAMGMYLAVSWHFYAAAKNYLTKWRKLALLAMPIMGFLCVIGSSSRGAVAGIAAAGFWVLLASKRKVQAFTIVAIVATAGWFVLPAEQKDRFRSAGEDQTSLMRKVYWLNGLDMTRTHPVLGIGYMNWLEYYARYYRESNVSQAFNVHTVQVAHNIFIQCMAELGYPGLLAFLLLIAGTMWINLDTRKRARSGQDPPNANNFAIHMAFALDEAMLCYLVAGFFVTVLYYPFFWINLALTVALNSIVRNKQRSAQPHPRRRAGAPRSVAGQLVRQQPAIARPQV